MEAGTLPEGGTRKWRGPADPWTLAFLGLLSCFIGFKVRTLHLPFFWDEAWVYAPAAKAMYMNGVSLLPDALAPSLSRGHPMLFHAACATWMHVFGTSRTAMHAFALSISAALLITVYCCGARTVSRPAAFGAAVFIAANEMFLAQSALVLPEVMLALFVLLTAWAYVKGKQWAYVLAATCALLTKESGLVLVVALLLWHVVRPLAEGGRRAGHWRWLVPLLAPVAIASLFFLCQYHVFGWVLYPEHLHMISLSERDVTYNLKLAFIDLFEAQGLSVFTYVFAFAVPVLLHGLDKRWAALAIVLYITAVKVLFGRWSLPSFWTIAVPVLCLSVVFVVLFLRAFRNAPERYALACIGFLFTFGFMGFSAMNFFSDRYLLCCIPFISLGAVAFFDDILSPYHRALPAVLMMFFATVLIGRIGPDERTSDVGLAYTDAIAVEQEAIHFCERQDLFDAPIHGSFLEQVYMTGPDAGYLSQGRMFTRVGPGLGEDVKYAIVTDLTPTEVLKQLDEAGFHPWHRSTSGHAWAEVRQRTVP